MPRKQVDSNPVPQPKTPAVTIEQSVVPQQPKPEMKPLRITELPRGVKIEHF